MLHSVTYKIYLCICIILSFLVLLKITILTFEIDVAFLPDIIFFFEFTYSVTMSPLVDGK